VNALLAAELVVNWVVPALGGKVSFTNHNHKQLSDKPEGLTTLNILLGLGACVLFPLATGLYLIEKQSYTCVHTYSRASAPISLKRITFKH
jgi:hypothetical protein